MNKDDFNHIAQEFMSSQQKLLLEKGGDYSHDGDRLANFKALSKDLGLPPLQVWYVYFKKHVDALAKLAREGTLQSEAPLSRFLDVANYAILGWALHAEEENEKYGLPMKVQDIEQKHVEALKKPAPRPEHQPGQFIPDHNDEDQFWPSPEEQNRRPSKPPLVPHLGQLPPVKRDI